MQFIKIIIFILLLFLLFKMLVVSFEKFLINDKKWLDYRLGDIVKGFFYKTNNKFYLDKIEKTLPDSIGGKYIIATKNLKGEEKINNFKILKKIIDDKKSEIPKKNDIVFHIRLGDIIGDFKNNVVVITKKNWGINLNQIENILKKMKNKNQKIILIYGSHKKKINMKANKLFLEEIKKILVNNNFQFEEKNSSNPDEDFVYMCNSKKFIKSGGGFSRLISNIVKLNGGKILN